MSANSEIEWTDATWNPTTGCDRVSPGCDHCYALTLAKRLKAMGSPRYQNDGDPTTSGPGFGFTMHPEALDQPLRWTRPKKIFVNSMSDLFHSSMSTDFLAEVFAVMSIATRHTFQVLTKRPGVMRSVLSSPLFKLQVNAARLQRGVSVLSDSDPAAWPLPHVWLGTSVEDQKRADLRIPLLLQTPAAVRFLSMEPLLGAVLLPRFCACGCGDLVETARRQARTSPGWLNADQAEAGVESTLGVDWVIVGGESGPGARLMDIDWARSLRDQCTTSGVAFHYKQQGSGDGGKKSRRELDGRTWDQFPLAVTR